MEAKATAEVGKGELATFELKVTDYYFSWWERVAAHDWYPILAAAGKAHDAARRLAAHRAITLCDPDRLPLPVLYHHATHPATRDELPEILCAELARLAPRALVSLQGRYVPHLEQGGLFLRPCPYTPEELDDLLFIQTS